MKSKASKNAHRGSDFLAGPNVKYLKPQFIVACIGKATAAPGWKVELLFVSA
jgi:hypothetical protein